MARFGISVGAVRGVDFDFCEGGYRWRQFAFGNGDTHVGRGFHVLGDGVSDTCAKWIAGDIPQKLAVSHSFGTCDRRSWLCYYKALQLGDASKVVPIDKLSVVLTLVLAFVFLHEEFTAKSLAGCILIGAGTLVMVL